MYSHKPETKKGGILWTHFIIISIETGASGAFMRAEERMSMAVGIDTTKVVVGFYILLALRIGRRYHALQ
jgi:hypothetical protein